MQKENGLGAAQPARRRLPAPEGEKGNTTTGKEKNLLVEEKIKEQQQEPAEAPQRPASWREKWRSLWARVQCFQIRGSHHIRKHTRQRVDKTKRRALSIPLARTVGELLYTIGFAAEYMAIRTGRWLRSGGRYAARAAQNVLTQLAETAFPEAAQIFRELFGPFYVFARGIRNLFVHGREVRRERGHAAALWAELCYMGRGIRRYANLLPKSVAYIIPIGAAALFWVVFQTMIGYHFTLAVQVDGVTVGYVENEGVFDAAREAVLERINYAGSDGNRWSVEPSYTLAVAADTMDANEMVDTLLRASSNEISEGTALYLDGELAVVCGEGNRLRSYVSGLISPYEDPEDPNVKVSFNREVELVDGLFFNDSFSDYDSIVEYLSGAQQEEKIYTVVAGDSLSLIASKNGLTINELCALNTDIDLNTNSMLLPGDSLTVTREEAMLEVRITRTVTRQEDIPYTTEKSTSSDYAYGTVRTIQAGVNGVRSITSEETYNTNGDLLESTIVRTEIVKEPVAEKIVTGTKLPSGSIAAIGNGTFMWPVPAYTYCSRWYSSGHKGVDICAPAGTPIYASDSGVVTKAGYERAGLGRGYGYGIEINHGSGYSTAYAHCLSIVVSVGQSVKQGQLIGYVGSTGRSTGNHCHFEIRYNGSYLPPQNYFKGK